jgi:hypothetical protein
MGADNFVRSQQLLAERVKAMLPAGAVRKARSGGKRKQLGSWSVYGCLMRIFDGCGLRFEWPGNRS